MNFYNFYLEFFCPSVCLFYLEQRCTKSNLILVILKLLLNFLSRWRIKAKSQYKIYLRVKNVPNLKHLSHSAYNFTIFWRSKQKLCSIIKLNGKLLQFRLFLCVLELQEIVCLKYFQLQTYTSRIYGEKFLPRAISLSLKV